MQDTPVDLHALFQALSDSAGIRCLAAEPLIGGSNNKLYRIETEDAGTLVAKKYFPDDRHRLEREFSLLTVLNERGFTEVPRPIARFDALDMGVYSFVEGQHIASEDFTRDHIDRIVAYLVKLHGVTKESVSQNVMMGFTAARSFSDVIALIRWRIEPFKGRSFDTLPLKIQHVLKAEHTIEQVETRLEAFIRTHDETQRTQQISDADLRLSSVDFGAHNMLWKADGSLVILDFEYGGWDHPCHGLADLLSHERNQGMGSENLAYFVDAYLRQSPVPSHVLRELNDYRTLAQLDWTMVFLSSILPPKLARLAFARGASHDVEAYVERQLKKVRERVERLPPLA